VIFVHGCFWHSHGDPSCRIAHLPTSRAGYWRSKLERNVARDRRQVQQLEALGWGVLTLWECEIRSEPRETLVSRLEDFLGRRTQ
jgi:DNA mismatch endonuclease (patch repair protein)